MAARRMPASLMLGLTPCLLAMTTAISVSQAPGNVTLAPALTPTGAGAGGNVSSDLAPVGGQGTNGTTPTWTMTPGNTTAWRDTQEDTSATAMTSTTTPEAALTTAPATTWTTATTSTTAPAMTSTMISTATQVSTASKMALPPEFTVWAGPNRTGTLVFLMLLLILLIVIFCGAWSRLRAFSSSYYPCRLDKGLYVNPEEGEGDSRGPRSVGRAFIVAVRNLLPWKPGVREVELEEEEEEEEWGQDEQSPRDGESEGEADGESEGEAGRGSSRGEGQETDQSDSDDYSSLGGLDLRERAARAEGEEGDSAGPASASASACGNQLLGDLHSFSGTAGWTDTNQDITVL
ncbi:uncharacterized protein [Heterodontus francisci]|uniref:uncharacterized protein n=1 Tax=Heterodontus francisci TaxID=7792 RepID=UPI00355AF438